MTDTRPVILGGRTFDVPRLPLRINRRAYPLCRALSNAGLLERAIDDDGRFVLECSEEEMDQLAELAFLAASAADAQLTAEAFEDMPVDPNELVGAFIEIRYQTGVWVAADAAATEGGQAAAGEAEGGA